MRSIITSYLLQTGKCALPYIGFFNSEYRPAEVDVVNKQIIAPAEDIVFNEETILLSPGLVSYIAMKKNISESEAGLELDNFCRIWKKKIDEGESLNLESFGSLQKNKSSNIYFTREDNLKFFLPVSAEKVLHQNAGHPVLVGDKETSSQQMTEYYNDVVPAKKNKWFFWAIVLAVIGLIMLGYTFYDTKISTSSIGNQNHFFIKTKKETYFNLQNN